MLGVNLQTGRRHSGSLRHALACVLVRVFLSMCVSVYVYAGLCAFDDCLIVAVNE